MHSPTIRFSKPSAQIALFEIDAPPANALGGDLRRKFLEGLAAVEQDFAVRAVVVTGHRHAFCSGDDLKEREAALQGGGGDAAASFHVLVDRIEACRAPVIAAVNGWAIGGGLELALGCDIRIASTQAQFVCAAVNVGLIASAWRLPRLIGVARAKHMLLTGLPFDAATAERFGLVSSVHPPETLADAALALAERIATRAPLRWRRPSAWQARRSISIPTERHACCKRSSKCW
ncbi:MAG: enoyl-CoA hydratase/isomerase family protein [Rhizomicrobium sp.]